MKDREKKLKLRFHKQEKVYSCAVACLKMVLEYFGKNTEEMKLRRICKTTELGTYADDVVSCARELGFRAEKAYLAVNELKKLTEANVFPIVYVNTYFLNRIFATHAVIVEDVTDEEILIIDPAEGRKTIALEIFMRIWDFCNNVAIVIKRS
jgi:ABC-type bacteriocin/lantibiotic exporter with double-glycine peptidase domain